MTGTPSFREELISQIPALRLLHALGYTYLSPDEAVAARNGRLSGVLLEGILAAQLRKINSFQYKGKRYSFPEAAIQEAIRRLKDEEYDGLVRTNEKIYDLLTGGFSFPVTLDGDTRSHDLKYIDWNDWQRTGNKQNVYHVSDEFSIEKRQSSETRRPDIILFVNGIPLVVIECKRPDLQKGGTRAVEQGISQMLRNQRDDEIPSLFVFSQILLSVSKNEAQYGTTGTSKEFWSGWVEEQESEASVHKLINKPLSQAEKASLYNHRERPQAIRAYFDAQEQAGERLPTEQDRTLYSLLRPERLLELTYQFIVYDAGIKKVARHQQYFAVKRTIERVGTLNIQGERTGGVIWHTTGSGKSLTMVMLAKALALHPGIRNPRVLLVTDRVDLDDQIWKTFLACGKSVHKAESGADLVQNVRNDKLDIITTVINKFESAVGRNVKNDDPNIFVLVDESHRSQYGSFHSKMKQIFTKACYIGFTGTPLLKSEKATVKKFGDFIHKYSMQQAVNDKAVVPLLYEGRMAELGVNQEQIDQWFERVTRTLNDDQKRDLKRKFSQREALNRTEQRIQQIAYDISEHYRANVEKGHKAQIAAASKETAILYKKYLDDFGEVTSEVVISPPDTREGNEEIDNTKAPAVEAFWKKMMDRFGTEKKYNQEILASFKREDGVEILIVVDKLLTGFDEPRNTVLYIDKPLKEHSLLQAISRVNRLFDENKTSGNIIDYRGVLGELNAALNTYNALAAFDREDVAGTLTDTTEEVKKLPLYHSALWDVFKGVSNKRDDEAFRRFLEPEDRRQEFYAALTDFVRSLKVALSTVYFYQETSESQINRYKQDKSFFESLRTTVRQRYAESIDYRDYEPKVRTLLNQHVTSSEVKPITELINIFDREAFASEVDKLDSNVAKADTIAYRVKKTIDTRVAENPVTYRRFSDLISETIEAYRAGRLSEIEYLNRVSDVLEQVQQGRVRNVPERLRHDQPAQAYYSVLQNILETPVGPRPQAISTELLADIAIEIEKRIENRKIRDWTANDGIQNAMKNDIDDYFDVIEMEHKLVMSGIERDLILGQVLEIAKKRDRI